MGNPNEMDMEPAATVVEVPANDTSPSDAADALIRRNFPVTRMKIVTILMILIGSTTFILQIAMHVGVLFQFGQGIWTSFFVILSAALGLKAANSRGSTLWVMLTFVLSILTMVPLLTSMVFFIIDADEGFWKYNCLYCWSSSLYRNSFDGDTSTNLVITQYSFIMIMLFLTLFLAIDIGIIAVKKCRAMSCNFNFSGSFESMQRFSNDLFGRAYTTKREGVVIGPYQPVNIG